jgi:carboxypeptidase T
MSRLPRVPILGLAVALAVSGALLTQNTATVPVARTDAPDAEQPREQYVFRVLQAVRNSERLLELGSDVLEARDGDDLFVLGDAREGERIRAAGFATSIESVMPAPRWTPPKVQRNAGPITPADINETYYGGYRTVRAHYAHLDKVAADFPELSSLVTYGQSWRKSTGRGGHDLRAICLTKKNPGDCEQQPNSAKPRFFLMAQIHAREITTGDMAWRWIDHLTTSYGRDAEVTRLMDTTETWVVPITNPDGVEIVQQGGNSPRLHRKNANDSNGSSCWLGQIGIDLNRNSDTHFGQSGTSTDPCSEIYRGPGPSSEVETKALEGLLARLFPDTRGEGDGTPASADTRGMLISLHSYTNGIIFPWSHRSNARTGNDASLRAMARDMAGITGYTYGTAPEVVGYAAAGGTDDWIYDKLGVPGFTFEIGARFGACSGFLPQYSCQESTHWPKIRPALMYAAARAAAPYR